MIKLEDKEFEASIIKEHYHIAVPVQVSVFADGRKECLVYSFTENLAKEYENTWDDLLAPEAIDWLFCRLTPLMTAIEYEADACSLFRDFRLLPENLGQLPTYNAKVELLTILTQADREETEDLELDAFEMDGSDPEDAMAVIREDGRIVCFAAVNDVIESDDTGGLDWIEVNVECAPAYRRKGYGAACVTALSRYYLQRGKGVKYLCDEDNLASIRTAERAGFLPYRRAGAFVYYTTNQSPADCE